jgi:hypothetical protein
MLHLSPVIRGRLTQIPLDIAAEISWRGKVEHFRDIQDGVRRAVVIDFAVSGKAQDIRQVQRSFGKILFNFVKQVLSAL